MILTPHRGQALKMKRMSMRKGQKIIDMGIIMSRGIALMKCQRKDQRIDRGLGIGKKTRSSPSSSPARLLTVAGEIKQRELIED